MTSNVEGTKAIRRATAILRRIGRGDSRGAGLSDITKALDLPRSTTHRILRCLVEEGLVEHDAARQRYFVGRLTYELGLTVTGDTLEIARWRVAVDRAAQRTGATAYLMSRSGLEATCVFKADGNAVIRVIPVEVGQRRFLGVGAGSTALLAALDPETSESVVRAVTPSLGDYPNLDAAVIRRIVAETRETGFAVSESNVVQDVIGIGMAIPRADGVPYLALSIAALAAQTSADVVAGWKRIVAEEIDAVLRGSLSAG